MLRGGIEPAGAPFDGVRLRHWYRHDWFDPAESPSRQWEWFPGAVLPGSARIRANGVPAFLQSSFPTGSAHGNFEVFAPAADGGILHRAFRPELGWRALPTIDPRGRLVRVVHALQGGFGDPGNFEVVAETGEQVSLNNAGLGYGQLLFYWCGNWHARDSGQGTWNGPFQIGQARRRRRACGITASFMDDSGRHGRRAQGV